MRFAGAVLIACTGCRTLLGIEDGVVGENKSDAAPDDDSDTQLVDSPNDVPTGCYGKAPFLVCPDIAGSSSPLPPTIVTTSTSNCDFNDSTQNRDWCVLVRDSINLTGSLRATGVRPLVIVSRGDLTVGLAGMIDVASHSGSGSGAGNNPSECSITGINGQFVTHGGGGAGGSFGSEGGGGGNGNNGTGLGGVPTVRFLDDELHGGCRGGRGGNSATVGGDGGGAIYLVAGATLRIDGSVNASGGGGTGGQLPGSGGSGGGSGGMIVLSAPMVLVTGNGQLFANGGGGGSGGGNNNDGATGDEPTSPDLGGLGDVTGSGGHGGNGAGGSAPGGAAGQTDGAGGGGGGGGHGRIRIFADSSSVTIGTASPSPN